jgi:hypothetical protein
MSLRALRAGMGVLLLAVALGMIGAQPAAAMGEGFWMQGWQWLVSVWGKTGPEIDPDGLFKPPKPPGGLVDTPPPPETTTTAARAPRGGGSAQGERSRVSVGQRTVH